VGRALKTAGAIVNNDARDRVHVWLVELSLFNPRTVSLSILSMTFHSTAKTVQGLRSTNHFVKECLPAPNGG
jgi:hypothetical protein